MARCSSVSLLILGAMLSACTAVHTPEPYLPAREGIAAGETITVQGNKNLYAIAREHNVSMRAIIVLNDMQAPFLIKPGQKLVLPAGASDVRPSDGSVTPAAAVATAVETAELPPVQVASKPALVSPNSVKAAKKTTQVDTLNAPSASVKTVDTTMAQAPAAMRPTEETPASVPSSDPPKMMWPVQGPVLSKFGSKGQGLSNDGVNIAAPKGSPVVAASNGIVVYAGNEMKGFGNLVLIRHQGGWVTAYAHLDRTLVAKDAVVAKGDMIGTVGKTGNVASPQLHFETRFKDKPVDPNGVIKEP